jgi:hypothetical protein
MKHNINRLVTEASMNYAHSKTPLPRVEAERIAANMSQQLTVGKV